MDPFSKRLRKQRERNSLQARQLNKNASSMLQRQIKVLDRRQQLNSHALRRDKEYVLRELEEFQHTVQDGLLEREDDGGRESSSKNGSHSGVDEDISYLVLNTAANTEPPPFNRRYVLPALWQTWKPALVLGDKKDLEHGAGADSVRPSARGRGKVELTNTRGVNRRSKVWTARSTESNEGTLSLDAAWLAIWEAECSPSNSSLSEPDSKTHHHHECESADGDTACRYSALSRMRPCSYFPCSIPSSYHHLMVSDLRNSVPLHWTNTEFGTLSQTGARNAPSSNLSDSFQSVDTQVSRTSTTSVSRRSGLSTLSPGNKTEASSSRAVSATSKARRADGHISPRTSIRERLRGLRQLVQELRDKNEAKRPRAWAVNYGDAVSRRLIRKPIAVGAVAE